MQHVQQLNVIIPPPFIHTKVHLFLSTTPVVHLSCAIYLPLIQCVLCSSSILHFSCAHFHQYLAAFLLRGHLAARQAEEDPMLAFPALRVCVLA